MCYVAPLASRVDIYGGRDPADIPAYSAAAAAALVGLPVSTLRSWVFGRDFHKRSGGRGRSNALIKTPDGGRFLSFTNVVEAHILSGLRRVHGVSLENIRKAVRYVERELKQEHPLAREQFKTDGVHLFVERLGRLINASQEGQVAIREVLDGYLQRVEYERGRAVRFFPLRREGAKPVTVVDPRRAWGRPVLVGTSVPVAPLQSRWSLGESIAEIAADFEVDAAIVEEALRGTTTKVA